MVLISTNLILSFLFHVKKDCWLLLGSLVWICNRQGFPEKQNQYYTYVHISVHICIYTMYGEVCIYIIGGDIDWLFRNWFTWLLGLENQKFVGLEIQVSVEVAVLNLNSIYSSRLETWTWFLCCSFEEYLFLFWKLLSFLLKLSTDWMSPTYNMEINQLYSESI